MVLNYLLYHEVRLIDLTALSKICFPKSQKKQNKQKKHLNLKKRNLKSLTLLKYEEFYNPLREKRISNRQQKDNGLPNNDGFHQINQK